VPDRSQGYVWPIYSTFEIVQADPNGENVRPLTNSPGYDAEATWCHQGGKIIFTSSRDGDLELYEMNEDGSGVRRLTNTPGYDGGAFYSADCKEIVWRASRPTGAAFDEFRSLLQKGLVRPTKLELFVMNADGTNPRQVTNNGAANFAPYFHPDGKRIIYSSNAGDPRGREFDIFLVSKSGGEPERVTITPGFDGFPMFSPDGQWLVWASNRANPTGNDTNLYIARWVD
jgi:Tol biopolymer transport system component